MRHRRLRGVLGTLVGFVALAVTVAFSVGWLSLATTHGISMLPKFHTGDLVILRSAGLYHVGEIVEYYSPLLHTTVLHRIVAESNGLFTFKGDNNSFIDPVNLPASSIRGVLWLHIPHGGTLLESIRTPAHAVYGGIVLVGLIAFGTTRNRRKSQAAGGAPPRRGALPKLGPSVLVVVGIVGAVSFGTLLVVSERSAGPHTASQSVPYAERLTFSYAATTKKSATYPSGAVSTGTPVFVNLVHNLDVRADYHLSSLAPTTAVGTIALQASLVATDGWTRVLATTAPIWFSGSDAAATLSLPIDRAVALMRQSATETGVEFGGASITVTPLVSLNGTVEGVPFAAKMSTALTFAMTPLELSLPSSASSTTSTASPGLVTNHSNSVELSSVGPGGLVVLGHRIRPGTSEAVGAGGLLGSLVLCALGLTPLYRRRSLDKEDRALHRIQHDLIAIGSDPSESARGIVDVTQIASLANLVERFDVAILDYEENGNHVYFVSIGDLLYRHRATPSWESDDNVILLNANSSDAATEEPTQLESAS